LDVADAGDGVSYLGPGEVGMIGQTDKTAGFSVGGWVS